MLALMASLRPRLGSQIVRNFFHLLHVLHKYSNYALWLSLLVIVILSLLPGDARPHTGAPGKFEHFIAYFGAGLFIAARYQALTARLIFWAGTASLSCILEFLQQFVPGRGPNPFDALASSSGLTVGILIGGAVITALWSLRELFVQTTAREVID
jgi:VanZ family protein